MDFAVLDRLVHHYSRYTLVIAVAKLARGIVDQEDLEDELLGRDVKPVTMALERIAYGDALLRRDQASDA